MSETQSGTRSFRQNSAKKGNERTASLASGSAWVPLLFTALAVSSLGAGPREDFAQLEAEMQAATEAYYSALFEAEQNREDSASGDPRPAAGKLRDPRSDVLKKMDALAQSIADTPDGRLIALNTFYWAVGVQPETLFQRFGIISRQNREESELAEVIISLPDLFAQSGSAEQWTQSLNAFARSTGKKDLKLAATFAAARIHMVSGQTSQAKSAFEDAIKLAADEPDAARAAKGYLFEIQNLQVGMKAPEFRARTLDDRDLTLSSLRGKVVLLDFWATWCAPCISEIPHLAKIAARFRERGFEIVAISLDDSREAVQNALGSLKVPGIVVWDEKGPDNPVVELYNVQSLPTWYLLDRDGVIRGRDLDLIKLESMVESILPADSRAKKESDEAAKAP